MRGQKILEAVPPRNISPVKGSVLDLVGNTPLVRINKITAGLPEGVEIYAKLEGFNPGGSVKDSEVIEAADKNDMTMVFTGERCFSHH